MTRLRLLFRLLRCCLLHGLTFHKGGYRCFRCYPKYWYGSKPAPKQKHESLFEQPTEQTIP